MHTVKGTAFEHTVQCILTNARTSVTNTLIKMYDVYINLESFLLLLLVNLSPLPEKKKH